MCNNKNDNNDNNNKNNNGNDNYFQAVAFYGGGGGCIGRVMPSPLLGLLITPLFICFPDFHPNSHVLSYSICSHVIIIILSSISKQPNCS